MGGDLSMFSQGHLVKPTEFGSSWFHDRDVMLGRHEGVLLISARCGDWKIWLLLRAADWAFDRCERTMRRTGRPVLCCRGPARPSESSLRPCEFRGRDASRRHRRYHCTRFIAFALGVHTYVYGPHITQQYLLGRLSGCSGGISWW